MQVRDIMSREVVAVDKDEHIERVLHLMEKHGISKLPVTEKGLLVGVVSDGEIADELGSLHNRQASTARLHVSSVMRRNPPTTHPDTDVRLLLETMQQENVGIVPVVHDRTVVGVVTKADLLPLVKDARPLKSIMVSRLHAVAPSDRVVHARRLMLDHGVERLPVLDQGNLVGIVAEMDVALGLANFRERVEENHQQAQLRNFLVEAVMRPNVVSSHPDLPIREAAKLMHDKHVGGLPLVNSGGRRIAGMVTRTDLLRTIQTTT